MMIFTKIALLVLSQLLHTAITQTPPKWVDKYTVGGIIYLPYAEIEESFVGWYDSESQNSRIDYYDGMVKTFQQGKGFGVRLKITPYTDEEVSNRTGCFQVNGTEDYQVTTQQILPDLSDFTYAGKDEDMDTWTLTTYEGEKKNSYKFWSRTNLYGDPTPLRYEMHGYNTLLGSHYDHYFLIYDSYTPYFVREGAFDISSDDIGLKEPCRSFPGPGKHHVHLVNPMAEFIRPEKTEHVDHIFEEFKNIHGKQYANEKEHALRKEAFRQNIRYIEAINRRNKGYSLAVNHLADKTPTELKYLRGRVASGEYNGGLPFPHTEFNKDGIPNNYDWRLYGAVTPVKDQAICGSCWAFGTVGTIEGALFLKNGGNLIRLSEQALVDCSWGFGNNGCDGGEDFRSYQWIMKHGGIPTDESYGPYLGENSYCLTELETAAPITGWVNVTTNNEDALRLAIFKYGPISVAIDASQRTFSFYSRGVYYDEKCGNKNEDLDHAVLAVGYGTLNGKNYWLIKNSWSTYWGKDGYILMASRDNNCGVMTTPTYVTL